MKFNFNKRILERLPETLQFIIAVIFMVAIAFLILLGFFLED